MGILLPTKDANECSVPSAKYMRLSSLYINSGVYGSDIKTPSIPAPS